MGNRRGFARPETSFITRTSALRIAGLGPHRVWTPGRSGSRYRLLCIAAEETLSRFAQRDFASPVPAPTAPPITTPGMTPAPPLTTAPIAPPAAAPIAALPATAHPLNAIRPVRQATTIPNRRMLVSRDRSWRAGGGRPGR